MAEQLQKQFQINNNSAYARQIHSAMVRSLKNREYARQLQNEYNRE